MKYLRESSWEEVKANWKDSEDNVIWQDFYRKKGFTSWENWRWSRIEMLSLAEREWMLAEPENVVKEVREMFCDATTRWTDFFDDREKSKFGDLASHPFFRNHSRVLSIREDFPINSQMIGLRHENNIILVDGHHRATAIAGMDESYPFSSLKFALSDISREEFEKYYNSNRRLKVERRIWDVMAVLRQRLKNV